jgi:hypothetical protein
VSKRITVRITASGDITVEALGFHGKGCEAATKAIEDALGKSGNRTRKPEFWRQSNRQQNRQKLGGGDG